MDGAAKNPHVHPKSVHQKVASAIMSDKQLSNSLAFLPTSACMGKKIQYERKKSLNLPPVPKDWNFTIPSEFKNTADGLEFLIGHTTVSGRLGRVFVIL